MIVITGGAGFIGSVLAARLEARGATDIVICDHLGRGDKWRNIAKRELADIVAPAALEAYLAAHAGKIEAIFHMGAISATTERDVDLIVATNFRLSLLLWNFCAAQAIRFFYASSAATYGAGESGFDDDPAPEQLARLRPLNAYGWSKHLFDRRVIRLAAERGPAPPQWVGAKFFNVFGANEYHKAEMVSVAEQIHRAALADRPATLFRSHRPDYADGGQLRDFVYVEDVVDMMLWLFDNPDVSGLFNMGSGIARSFRDVACAVFAAMGRPAEIDFVDTPVELRARYQYFTQAKLDRLRRAGYTRPTTSLEAAIRDYVGTYLSAEDPYL